MKELEPWHKRWSTGHRLNRELFTYGLEDEIAEYVNTGIVHERLKPFIYLIIQDKSATWQSEGF